MYTIKMSITDEHGKVIDFTILQKVANRAMAFILLAEWSNALKQMIKELIEKQKSKG